MANGNQEQVQNVAVTDDQTAVNQPGLQQPEKKSRLWMWIIIVLVVIAVVGVIWLYALR